jgi:hypothetical protein
MCHKSGLRKWMLRPLCIFKMVAVRVLRLPNGLGGLQIRLSLADSPRWSHSGLTECSRSCLSARSKVLARNNCKNRPWSHVLWVGTRAACHTSRSNCRKPSFVTKGLDMSEQQSGIAQNPQSQPAATSPACTSAPGTFNSNGNIHSLIVLCSLGLIGCFFLPWITIFLGTPSGFQIQQLPGTDAKLVWFIPIGGLLALFAAVTKQSVRSAAKLAGGLPFVALVYYWKEIGDGFFQALQIGAWLTLIVAAVLFVLPSFLTKPKP